jgi:hypothetical protein
MCHVQECHLQGSAGLESTVNNKGGTGMLLQQQQSGLTKHDAPNEHHFLE